MSVLSRLFLLPGAVALLLASPLLLAQPDPAERIGDWIKVCEPIPNSTQKTCGIIQNVIIQETGESVLKAVVREESIGHTVLLSLPLGFALPPGIEVRVDQGAAVRYPVQTCTNHGCLSGWLLDDAKINAMKRGATMTVTLLDLNGTPFEIPISLTGFTKGFEAIRTAR